MTGEYAANSREEKGFRNVHQSVVEVGSRQEFITWFKEHIYILQLQCHFNFIATKQSVKRKYKIIFLFPMLMSLSFRTKNSFFIEVQIISSFHPHMAHIKSVNSFLIYTLPRQVSKQSQNFLLGDLSTQIWLISQITKILSTKTKQLLSRQDNISKKVSLWSTPLYCFNEAYKWKKWVENKRR
jgi:hypothetical protein